MIAVAISTATVTATVPAVPAVAAVASVIAVAVAIAPAFASVFFAFQMSGHPEVENGITTARGQGRAGLEFFLSNHE